MFKPSTEKINKLAKLYPKSLIQLKTIFNKSSSVYIDFANVIHWSEKLKWHIDLKRLKQLLDSFGTVKYVRFYNGLIKGNKNSQKIISEAKKLGYKVTTKLVKKMQLSIDVSGINKSNPAVLHSFIKKCLLKKLPLEAIEYLNKQLEELNNRGIKSIEHWKCNFDVEIGRDMLIDHEHNKINSFILWSGDSDFADPVTQLLNDKKYVCIFATARRVSPELNATGVKIFEIWKIKDFICWKRELSTRAKHVITTNNAKRTP